MYIKLALKSSRFLQIFFVHLYSCLVRTTLPSHLWHYKVYHLLGAKWHQHNYSGTMGSLKGSNINYYYLRSSKKGIACCIINDEKEK